MMMGFNPYCLIKKAEKVAREKKAKKVNAEIRDEREQRIYEGRPPWLPNKIPDRDRYGLWD